MQNDKVTASKRGVNDMLVYYHQALVEAGCGDPKQVIATELANMIKLSDKQTEYVIDNAKGLSAQDMLTNIFILLTKMEQDNKVDKSSIKLIKQNIEILTKMIRKGSLKEI